MTQLPKSARIVSPPPDCQPIALVSPLLFSVVSVFLRDLRAKPCEPRGQTAA